MKIFRGTQGLPFLLILGAVTLPGFVVARSSELTADVKDVSLVVEGTIQTIHSPLIPPGTAVNPRPTPDLTFKVDLVVYGEFPDVVFRTEKVVFDWPVDLVEYKKGERCVLFLRRAPDFKLFLHSVLPAGKDPWGIVDSLPDLRQLIKVHLLSQIKENKSPSNNSALTEILSGFSDPLDNDNELAKKSYSLMRKQADALVFAPGIDVSRLNEISQADPLRNLSEQVHILSRLLDPADLEKLIHPYVYSGDKFVRHAAIGGLVCGNPSAQNVLLAQKDIESALIEKDNASIVVGTLSENGIDQLQYSMVYYDCLPGPIPEDPTLADLWRWIGKKDRELHPDSWPYEQKAGATKPIISGR